MVQKQSAFNKKRFTKYIYRLVPQKFSDLTKYNKNNLQLCVWTLLANYHVDPKRDDFLLMNYPSQYPNHHPPIGTKLEIPPHSAIAARHVSSWT